MTNLDTIACSGSKVCPISSTPCPGPCIYADVMASLSLGVVVFDLTAKSVHFCNRWMGEFLGRVGIEVSFVSLSRLLLDQGDAPIRLGAHFLGISAFEARGFAWVFVRDVTERTRLEAVAEAVETTNNIGYIFSAVRHELGNPINSIKVALGVLDANVNDFSRDAIAEYVQRMSTEVGRIEHLLRSLRSFSAFERPEVAPVHLPQFLAGFLGLVGPELSKRGIEVVSELRPEVVATCDSRALHHVLLNLVTNASDALAAQNKPRLAIRCDQAGALAFIHVEDNGVGISAERQAHLFKPFNTTKPKGTGLGLAIARKLLASMDSTIDIDSAEGRGTRVQLTLPRPRMTRLALA
ncbi:MAG: HAMP domain-containing histidine kinase [Deltaproteobacteria bacterium]|nr:HAMP domain-containing histidine kinase [Deltaproteobacteria bacterium]